LSVSCISLQGLAVSRIIRNLFFMALRAFACFSAFFSRYREQPVNADKSTDLQDARSTIAVGSRRIE